MDLSTFVGLDVHKKSTSVAIAESGRGGAARCGFTARSRVRRRHCDDWSRSWSGLVGGFTSVMRPGLAAMACIGCYADWAKIVSWLRHR